MRVLDRRRPNAEARLFAEAQSLIDDGLDRGLVLELYPQEAPWLAPLLSTTDSIIGGARGEEASWYFEASLKNRFIEAGVRRARQSGPSVVSAPGNGWSRMRAGVAASGVAAGAGVAGVVALGLVTADTAAPGDWNYAFKLGQERLDYRLSDGERRVSIQLNQTGARVQEIIDLSNSGTITESDLNRLEKEAEELTRLAQKQGLDEEQKDRLVQIAGTATEILTEVEEKQPELAPQARKSKQSVQDAVAAGLTGPIQPLDTSTPTATATASPTLTPTATPSATPETPTATASPTPSSTATPTETATEEPTAEETPTPEATAEEPTESPTVEGAS